MAIRSALPAPCLAGSSLRAVIDIGAVVDVENVHGACVLTYPVDDSVSSATGPMAAGEGAEKRLAHPVRVLRERGIAEFQHCCGHRLG